MEVKLNILTPPELWILQFLEGTYLEAEIMVHAANSSVIYV